MNALILFSYANIHSIDDVKPFYKHIFHGNVKESSLQRGMKMYRSLATCDPLAPNTERIGKSLIRRLKQLTGEEWQFYIGNKHIEPFVEDAVKQCLKDGARRIVTLALTPFYSRTGIEMYEKEVIKNLKKQNAENISLLHIPPFYYDPNIIDVFSDRLQHAIHWLPKSLRNEANVIFTAHSMPGRPEAHQVFIQQFKTLSERLIATTAINKYYLAYRSQGDYPQIWLEPNVLSVIKNIAKNGGKAIVVCELLSVIANAEAITELNVESKTLAEDLGMYYVQTEYLNDSDDFLTALSQYVFQKLTEEKS